MNAHGCFLGTSAGLTADLSLVLGPLVALTLTVGVVMARRRSSRLRNLWGPCVSNRM
jgi:hypothetical protein